MDIMEPTSEDGHMLTVDKIIGSPSPSPSPRDDPQIEILLDELNISEKIEEAILPITVYTGLEQYQCHFNWISNSDKLTKNVAQTVINVLNDKLSENAQDGEASLKYLGIECVSFRAALAFLSSLLERHVDAQRHLYEAFQDINTIRTNGFVEEEYIDGLCYVLQGLNVFHVLQSHLSESNKANQEPAVINEDEIRPLISGLGVFSGLSPKSQAAVLATRHYFDGELRKSNEEQFKLLRQMIQLDDYYLWHFRLHNQLRFYRREQDSRSHSPSADEVKEIIKAVEMEPDHPLLLVMDCLCVAELMKSYGSNDLWRCPMTYGNKEYTSIQAVVDYIKVQTKKILDKHAETVRINVHIAEFFSTLLPHEYRDLSFAKECLQRALQFHPNSSKAHHKMGNFLLHMEDNFKEAIKHFERALECDERNFPAKADLLKSYMSDPHGNYDKINEMLRIELLNPKWNSSRLASLYFINGCFLLLTSDQIPENEIAGAFSWLKACEISKDALDFKSISFITKRYKWASGKLSTRVVTKAVQGLVQSGIVDPLNEHLIVLRRLVKQSHVEASVKSNHKQGRGGGRCSGNFSRGSRENVNNYRRGSTSSVNEDIGDGMNPAKPYSRGPRRFSNSAAVDENGMKVVIERNPIPPNGPGFQRRGRPISSSESNVQ